MSTDETTPGPDLDLDGIEDMTEESDHFIATHPDHGTFRVEKSDMTAEDADTARSIMKGLAAAREAIASEDAQGVRHAAGGDVVPGDGGDSIYDAATEQDLLDPNRQTTASPFYQGAAPPPVDAVRAEQAAAGPHPLDALGAAYRSFVGHPAVDKNYTPEAAAPTFDPHNPPALTAGAQGAVPPALPGAMATNAFTGKPIPPVPTTQPIVDTSAQYPEGREGNALGDAYLAQHGIESPGVAPTASAEPPVPEIPTLDKFDASQIQNGIALEQQGITDRANEQSRLAKENAAIQDQTNGHLADMAARYKADHDETIARQQAAFDDLSKSPLKKLDTGFRGAIAVALGAFGAGLTGGPNYALQIINKRIDDDMKLQMARRNEKQNAINFYREKGFSLDGAYRLARADKTAELAGHLNAAAFASGSPQAIAGAKIASGQLMQKTASTTAEAYLSELRAQTAPIVMKSQLETARIDRAYRLSEARKNDAIAARDRMKASTSRAANEVENAFLTGQPIAIDHRAALSKDARDSGVPIGGRLYAANDADSAKIARKAQSSYEEMKSALHKIRDFRENRGRAFAPGSSAEARELQRIVQLILKSSNDLGTLDKGSQQFMDELVENPGAIFTNDETIFAGLRVLDADADTRRESIFGTQLVNPAAYLNSPAGQRVDFKSR